MPELPEVETVRRSLAKAALGRRVVRFEWRREDLRHPIPVERLAELLPGQRFEELERRGKLLIGRFGDRRRRPHCLLAHLGMSGRFQVSSPAEPWLKHEHYRLVLEGVELRYIDPRRFGSLEYAAADELEGHPRLANIGVEPLGPGFDGALLYTACRRRSLAIRDLLLSGRPVAGVGNIYANEACFRSGIRPQRRARTLSRRDCATLCAEIKAVLTEAIEAGGSTLRDAGYVDAAGRAGWFQFAHFVYDRADEACRRCQQGQVKRVQRMARGAFYCPICQS